MVGRVSAGAGWGGVLEVEAFRKFHTRTDLVFDSIPDGREIFMNVVCTRPPPSRANKLLDQPQGSVRTGEDTDGREI